MKKIEFVVLENGDTIQPNYACGLNDKSVDASWHGERWAALKLVDLLEKHIAKCDVCKGSIQTWISTVS